MQETWINASTAILVATGALMAGLLLGGLVCWFWGRRDLVTAIMLNVERRHIALALEEETLRARVRSANTIAAAEAREALEAHQRRVAEGPTPEAIRELIEMAKTDMAA
jgi:predicted lipid-binding transport protein (Tim44 family)